LDYLGCADILEGQDDPTAIAAKIKPLYDLSLNKWYFDEIYDQVFVQGLRRVATSDGS